MNLNKSQIAFLAKSVMENYATEGNFDCFDVLSVVLDPMEFSIFSCDVTDCFMFANEHIFSQEFEKPTLALAKWLNIMEEVVKAMKQTGNDPEKVKAMNI